MSEYLAVAICKVQVFHRGSTGRSLLDPCKIAQDGSDTGFVPSFVLADSVTNKWGRLRAQLGHPDPYNVQYIEIGNEDFTSTTYDYRWERFYDAMKKAYPHLNFVATAHIDGVSLPAVDVHDFSGPTAFYGMFSR
ncbi:hypothetical protein PHLCEN_2v4173 [Hermanssonia centrifuga]|uniref:Alpha-L-arabinofuranosidase 1 catalytic domain-containing protein n=1 Tax=Hermanssonia centrifuga TaxID=98765 RepID=A0A2R6PZ41_9APHY|nr:hypothetical protein PHLCEN_2v4173 [Hermanssonia centrifuga]